METLICLLLLIHCPFGRLRVESEHQVILSTVYYRKSGVTHLAVLWTRGCAIGQSCLNLRTEETEREIQIFQ